MISATAAPVELRSRSEPLTFPADLRPDAIKTNSFRLKDQITPMKYSLSCHLFSDVETPFLN